MLIFFVCNPPTQSIPFHRYDHTLYTRNVASYDKVLEGLLQTLCFWFLEGHPEPGQPEPSNDVLLNKSQIEVYELWAWPAGAQK